MMSPETKWQIMKGADAWLLLCEKGAPNAKDVAVGFIDALPGECQPLVVRALFDRYEDGDYRFFMCVLVSERKKKPIGCPTGMAQGMQELLQFAEAYRHEIHHGRYRGVRKTAVMAKVLSETTLERLAPFLS